MVVLHGMRQSVLWPAFLAVFLALNACVSGDASCPTYDDYGIAYNDTLVFSVSSSNHTCFCEGGYYSQGPSVFRGGIGLANVLTIVHGDLHVNGSITQGSGASNSSVVVADAVFTTSLDVAGTATFAGTIVARGATGTVAQIATSGNTTADTALKVTTTGENSTALHVSAPSPTASALRVDGNMNIFGGLVINGINLIAKAGTSRATAWLSTCAELKRFNPAAESGIYWLTPENSGGEAVQTSCDMERDIFFSSCAEMHTAFPTAPPGLYTLKWSNSPTPVYCRSNGTLYQTCAELKASHGYTWNQQVALAYLGVGTSPVPVATLCDFSGLGAYVDPPTTCSAFKDVYTGFATVVSGPTWISHNGIPAPVACNFSGPGALFPSCNAIKEAIKVPNASLALHYVGINGSSVPVAVACNMAASPAAVATVPPSCAAFKALPGFSSVISGPTWVSINGTEPEISYCDFSGPGLLYTTCVTASNAFMQTWTGGRFWLQWSDSPVKTYCDDNGLPYASCAALKAAVPTLTGENELHYLGMGSPNTIPVAVACNMSEGSVFTMVPTTCADFRSRYPLVVSGPAWVTGYSGSPGIAYCNMVVSELYVSCPALHNAYTSFATIIAGQYWLQYSNAPINAYCDGNGNFYTTCAALKSFVGGAVTANPSLQYLGFTGMQGNIPIAASCNMLTTGTQNTPPTTCAAFKGLAGFAGVVNGPAYIGYGQSNIGYCQHSAGSVLYKTCGLLKADFPALPQGQFWLQWSNREAYVHCNSTGGLFSDCGALRAAFGAVTYTPPYYLSLGSSLDIPVATNCDMVNGVLATPPTTCAGLKALGGWSLVVTGAAYIKYFPNANVAASPVLCDFASSGALIASCAALKTAIPFLSTPLGMYSLASSYTTLVPLATACDLSSTPGVVASPVPQSCAAFKSLPGFSMVTSGPVWLNYSVGSVGGTPGPVYCDYHSGSRAGVLFPTCNAMHTIFSSPTRAALLHWLQWSELPAPVYCDAAGNYYSACGNLKSAFSAAVGTPSSALFYLGFSSPSLLPLATACDMSSTGVYAAYPTSCETFKSTYPAAVSGPAYIKYFAGAAASPSPVVCNFTGGTGALAPDCAAVRSLIPAPTSLTTGMWYVGTGGSDVPVATQCDMSGLVPSLPMATCGNFRTTFSTVVTGPVWLNYGGTPGVAYCDMTTGVLYTSCATKHAVFPASPAAGYWLQWSTTSPARVYCDATGGLYTNCSALQSAFGSDIPPSVGIYYLGMPSINTPVASGCDMTSSPAMLAPTPTTCADFKAAFVPGVSYALVSGTARVKYFDNVAPAAVFCDFSALGVMMISCAAARTAIASLTNFGVGLAYLGIASSTVPVAVSCNWPGNTHVVLSSCAALRSTPGHGDVLTGPAYLTSLAGGIVYCDNSGASSVMYPTCEARYAVFPLLPAGQYWLQWSTSPAQVYCNASGSPYPSCLALRTAFAVAGNPLLTYLANQPPNRFPVATLCNMLAPGSPYPVASTPASCTTFKTSYPAVVPGPTMVNMASQLTMVYCDGTGTLVPFPSCRALFTAYPGLAAGMYYLQWSNGVAQVYCDSDGELFETCADLKTFVGNTITSSTAVVYLGMNSSSPIPVATPCDMSGLGVLAAVPATCAAFKTTYGTAIAGPMLTSYGGVQGIAYCDATATPVLHMTCATLRSAYPAYTALVAGPYWLQWSNQPALVWCNGAGAGYSSCSALGSAFPGLVGNDPARLYYLQMPGMPVPVAAGCDMQNESQVGYASFPTTCSGFKTSFGSTGPPLVSGPTYVKAFQNAPPAPIMCDFVNSGGNGFLMPTCAAVKLAMPLSMTLNGQLVYIDIHTGTGMPIAAACDLASTGVFSVAQSSCVNFKNVATLNAVVSGPTYILHNASAASAAYCDFSSTGALYPTCQSLKAAFPHVGFGQYWLQWSNAPANVYCNASGALFADCAALKTAVPTLGGTVTLHYLNMGSPHDIPVATPCDMSAAGTVIAAVPTSCSTFRSTVGLTTVVSGPTWIKFNPHVNAAPQPVMCNAPSNAIIPTCASVKIAVPSLTTPHGLFYIGVAGVYPVAVACDLSGPTGATSAIISSSCAEFKAQPGFSSVVSGPAYISYANPTLRVEYCDYHSGSRAGALFPTCTDIKTIFGNSMITNEQRYLQWSERPVPVFCQSTGVPYTTCALLKSGIGAAIIGTNANALSYLAGGLGNLAVAHWCDMSATAALKYGSSCAAFKAQFPDAVSGVTMIKTWTNALAPPALAVCDFRNDSVPAIAPDCATIRTLIPAPTVLPTGMWYIGMGNSSFPVATNCDMVGLVPVSPPTTCQNFKASFSTVVTGPVWLAYAAGNPGVAFCDMVPATAVLYKHCSLMRAVFTTLPAGLYWLQWSTTAAAQVYCDVGGGLYANCSSLLENHPETAGPSTRMFYLQIAPSTVPVAAACEMSGSVGAFAAPYQNCAQFKTAFNTGGQLVSGPTYLKYFDNIPAVPVFCDYAAAGVLVASCAAAKALISSLAGTPSLAYLGISPPVSATPVPIATACDWNAGAFATVPGTCELFRATPQLSMVQPGPTYANYGTGAIAYCNHYASPSALYTSCESLKTTFNAAPAGGYHLQWSNSPAIVYCNSSGSPYWTCADLKAAHSTAYTVSPSLVYLSNTAGNTVPVATPCNMASTGPAANYAPASLPATCANFKALLSATLTGPTLQYVNAQSTIVYCYMTTTPYAPYKTCETLFAQFPQLSAGPYVLHWSNVAANRVYCTSSGVLYPNCTALKTAFPSVGAGSALAYLSQGSGFTVPVGVPCDFSGAAAPVAALPTSCNQFKTTYSAAAFPAGPYYMQPTPTSGGQIVFCDASATPVPYVTTALLAAQYATYGSVPSTLPAGAHWVQWSTNSPVKMYADANGVSFATCAALQTVHSATIPAEIGAYYLSWPAAQSPVPVAVACDMAATPAVYAPQNVTCASFKATYGVAMGPTGLATGPTYLKYFVNQPPSPVICDFSGPGTIVQTCASVKALIPSPVTTQQLVYIAAPTHTTLPVATPCNLLTGAVGTMYATCAAFKTGLNTVVSGPTWTNYLAPGVVAFCDHTPASAVLYKTCAEVYAAYPNDAAGPHWLQWSNVAANVYCNQFGEYYSTCSALKTAYPAVSGSLMLHYLAQDTTYPVPVATACNMATGATAVVPATCAAFKSLVFSPALVPASGPTWLKWYTLGSFVGHPVMCNMASNLMYDSCATAKASMPTVLTMPFALFYVGNGLNQVPVATACDMSGASGLVSTTVAGSCSGFKLQNGFGAVVSGPTLLSYTTAANIMVVYCDYATVPAGILYPTCSAIKNIYPNQLAGATWLQWSEDPAMVFCQATGAAYTTCAAVKTAHGAAVGTSALTLTFLHNGGPNNIPVGTLCDYSGAGVPTAVPETCEDFYTLMPSVVSGPTWLRPWSTAPPVPVICDFRNTSNLVYAADCAAVRSVIPLPTALTNATYTHTLVYIGTGNMGFPVATSCDMSTLAPSVPVPASCAAFKSMHTGVITSPTWVGYDGAGGGMAYCDFPAAGSGSPFPTCATRNNIFPRLQAARYWLQWSATAPVYQYCDVAGGSFSTCAALKTAYPSVPTGVDLYYLTLAGSNVPTAVACDMTGSATLQSPAVTCLQFKTLYNAGAQPLVSGPTYIKGYPTQPVQSVMCDFAAAGTLLTTCAAAKTAVPGLAGSLVLTYLGWGGLTTPVGLGCDFTTTGTQTSPPASCAAFKTIHTTNAVTGPVYLSLSPGPLYSYCDFSGAGVFYVHCRAIWEAFPSAPSGPHWQAWAAAAPYTATCDMTTDASGGGAGWTLVGLATITKLGTARTYQPPFNTNGMIASIQPSGTMMVQFVQQTGSSPLVYLPVSDTAARAWKFPMQAIFNTIHPLAYTTCGVTTLTYATQIATAGSSTWLRQVRNGEHDHAVLRVRSGDVYDDVRHDGVDRQRRRLLPQEQRRHQYVERLLGLPDGVELLEFQHRGRHGPRLRRQQRHAGFGLVHDDQPAGVLCALAPLRQPSRSRRGSSSVAANVPHALPVRGRSKNNLPLCCIVQA